jgi:methionyl-tRNA synthetase
MKDLYLTTSIPYVNGRAIVAVAEAGNRLVAVEEPWHLAKSASAGDSDAAARFAAVLGAILEACGVLARELEPFVPGGARRLAARLEAHDAEPTFPRRAAGGPLRPRNPASHQ